MRQTGNLGTFGANGEGALDVVRGGANGLTGGLSGFAALLGLLNGGAFDFVLGAVEFGFELFTGFFELAHAFAEAAGEHRKFFGTEEDEDEDADDEQLWGSEGAEAGDDRKSIHEDSHTLLNVPLQ